MWRPIDELPEDAKDGRLILLYGMTGSDLGKGFEPEVVLAAWNTDDDAAGRWEAVNSVYYHLYVTAPTLWMAVPPVDGTKPK